MKNVVFLVCLAGISLASKAQLVAKATCPDFSIDLLDGRFNQQIRVNVPNSQIIAKFPCYTSIEADTTKSKCGAIVFYKDRDVYFYTARDYVVIGEKFKGKLSIPVMGAARTSLFKLLGNPKIKDTNWDAFQTMYGTLVLYFNKANKVNKILFSTNPTETLSICE